MKEMPYASWSLKEFFINKINNVNFKSKKHVIDMGCYGTYVLCRAAIRTPKRVSTYMCKSYNVKSEETKKMAELPILIYQSNLGNFIEHHSSDSW